ncbi:site-2 protease family protein [Methanobacterium formicicum]|uniref:Peptidase M50 n=1 Tax=Methanobacterium formicicum (strain DSM 3637 / PP1) TaxID=1204725 RepID=K2QCY5_METFP|nr:site-2 protease family protein [Methanobacterium formicicum]EKF85851.1 peptidase M50 [Methanobacterium formicicum DSM 3637]
MDDFTLIEQSISNYFPIIGFFNGEGSKEGSYFIVGDYNPHSFQSLVNELDQFGFVPFINPDGLHYRINVARKPEKGQSKIHVNIILLLATIGTTLFAGYYLGQGDMWKAVAFAVALLTIIGTHELAHFFAARKHGVDATLPYFIPAPTIIGTFGALINIKSAIPTRKALFDLGYSGPLAGFIVAIPVLLIGLKYSTVATNPDVAIAFTPPLIMQLFSYLVAPAASSGQMIMMHPVAFAGWVGILVTMLNLMPVAFLDGGHISRSLFGVSVHKFVSILGIMVTIILGWYLMAALMVFIFLMGKGHPGALDNVAPMDRKRKIIAVVILIIFVLCLSPAPNNFM